MRFSDLVGQHRAKAQILGMWRQNHLPHALLINGNEGTGGLPMALALCQFLLCSNKQNDDACGQCPNCQKVDKLEHADLHFSFPSIKPEKKKEALSSNYIKDFRKFVRHNPYGSIYEWLQFIDAENKQGKITSEECRQIIEQLNLKAYEGGLKIMVIWRPEFMGKEGNILLKLIEEPPADTLIILVSEQTEDMLATILSRVQMIQLPPIKPEDIAAKLVQSHQIERQKAEQIALMSAGNFAQALHLLQHLENDLFPQAKDWFNQLFTQNGVGIGKFVDNIAKQGREQQKNFILYIIHLLEACIRYRYSQKSILANEELVFIQKLAAMPLSFETLHQLIESLNETHYYIQRNANARIQFMALSLKMMFTIQNKKVSSLVQ